MLPSSKAIQCWQQVEAIRSIKLAQAGEEIMPMVVEWWTKQWYTMIMITHVANNSQALYTSTKDSHIKHHRLKWLVITITLQLTNGPNRPIRAPCVSRAAAIITQQVDIPASIANCQATLIKDNTSIRPQGVTALVVTWAIHQTPDIVLHSKNKAHLSMNSSSPEEFRDLPHPICNLPICTNELDRWQELFERIMNHDKCLNMGVKTISVLIL